MPAHQGLVMPTDLPGGHRRKLCIEIGGGGEDGAGNVAGVDVIGIDHLPQQLTRAGQNSLAGVLRDDRCPSDTPAHHGH